MAKLNLVSGPSISAPEAVAVTTESVVISTGEALPVAPAKKEPFGGKRHTLTAEDRVKAKAAQAAKALQRKEDKKAGRSKKIAKSQEVLRQTAINMTPPASDGKQSQYFKNETHATWKFYTREVADQVFQLATAECETSLFFTKLAGQLQSLCQIKRANQEYVLSLRHRSTGVFVMVYASKTALTFATTFADASKLPVDFTADLSKLVESFA